MLGTMIRNIAVAEDTDNLLCQDTGIPIYNVWIGRGVEVDGVELKEAIRRGCERATREHPLRSSVVHPVTRKNEHTSTGRGVPVIHIDFSDAAGPRDRDDPQGIGLGEQFLAAHGGPGRRRRRHQAFRRRLRARGRRQDLPADDRGRRRGRHRRPLRAPRQGRRRRGRSARAARIRRARKLETRAHRGGQPPRRRARRGWAAIPPPSRCTSRPPPRTSP